MSELIERPTTAPAVTHLQSLGLSESDMPRVLALSTSLQTPTANAVQAFGREASKRTAEFADSMLEEVRNSDLDTTGRQLGEVVRLARTIDLKQVANRSSLPVIGPLIDRFRATRGDLVQAFSSTRQQVDQLVEDIGRTQEGITKRNAHLDTMQQAVREEHYEMGLHIAAGELALKELTARREQLAGESSADPMRPQEIADLDAGINMLEKRVADLRVLQHAALQAIPTIRLIQSQNALLQDKFQNIRALTIPTWKRTFVLQLALNDQANAVRLAQNIDDATNQMLRSSADLLRDNAVSTAKANQRLVIDVETLQYVHSELLRTLQEVRQANEEGLAKRKQTEAQLLGLRNDIQRRLAPPTSTVH